MSNEAPINADISFISQREEDKSYCKTFITISLYYNYQFRQDLCNYVCENCVTRPWPHKSMILWLCNISLECNDIKIAKEAFYIISTSCMCDCVYFDRIITYFSSLGNSNKQDFGLRWYVKNYLSLARYHSISSSFGFPYTHKEIKNKLLKSRGDYK